MTENNVTDNNGTETDVTENLVLTPGLTWPTLVEVPPELLDRLHGRLAASADRAGVLDIAFRELDTSVGRLLLAGTEAGLLRIAFEQEGHAQVLADLAHRVSPRILRRPGRLDRVASQLDDYFAGRRRHFDLTLDPQLTRGFRREVLSHLPDIPYGRTESYGEVAAATGRPRAVRAVGTACATNPWPIVVPCHRVLRSGGGLGGYLGGLAAKAALLKLEASATPA